MAGKGEEEEQLPRPGAPQAFRHVAGGSQRAEWLERQCPFVCYLWCMARHGLIPGW